MNDFSMDWDQEIQDMVDDLLLDTLVLELCRALEEERMPYALHLDYSDETAATLPAQLEELQPLGSLLVLLYAQGASPETQQAVFQQVRHGHVHILRFLFAVFRLDAEIGQGVGQNFAHDRRGQHAP